MRSIAKLPSTMNTMMPIQFFSLICFLLRPILGKFIATLPYSVHEILQQTFFQGTQYYRASSGTRSDWVYSKRYINDTIFLKRKVANRVMPQIIQIINLSRLLISLLPRNLRLWLNEWTDLKNSSRSGAR